VEETASARTRAWVSEKRFSANFLISWWVETEIASALSKKVREGQIGIADRDRGMIAFKTRIGGSAEPVPVLQDHFRTAERLCLHEAAGLRAADALHLAISSANDAALCTCDKRLADAGPRLGLAAILV
jgi:predicted nucleic acid-binding protein